MNASIKPYMIYKNLINQIIGIAKQARIYKGIFLKKFIFMFFAVGEGLENHFYITYNCLNKSDTTQTIERQSFF